MAPPPIRNLDIFSDAQFRDVIIRNEQLVASEANIISTFYNHVSGTTANVSAAEVVSIDASNQGQWDLLLGTSARRLDANTITTANTASWSANAIISVKSANTTIRSANVIVGNLNATTITGNLRGTQTGITSVGTLSSLTVSGNFTVDTNTLVVNSASNRVGIATAVPGHALDVTGSTNVSGTYKIGGTDVLTSGGLGTGIASSRLTSVGTLTNLNVSGNVIAPSARIGNTTSRTFTKTLTAVVNDWSAICDMTGGAAFGFELAVVQSTAGVAIAKYYSGTSNFNSTGGQWKRLIPLSSTHAGNWDVDLSVLNSAVSFRLVRLDTSITVETSFSCTLKIHNPLSPVKIVDNTTVGSDATNTGLFKSTCISQINGFVGIGTSNPLSALDVVGTANIRGDLTVTGNVAVGNLSANAISGTLSTASQPNITSVGTLTTLTAGNTNITGNLTVASGGVTQLDKLVVRSFDVSLGISLNNATELCKIEGSNLAYVADLSVMQAQSSVYNVGKQYTFSVSDSTLTGTNVWHRLVPLASSEQNNVIVEIQHNNGITNLRLVRPAAGGDTVFACVLKLHLPPSGSVTVTPLSGTSTVAGGASTTMFENTLVTQVNGRVGINTDAPASGYQLDVRGNAIVNGTMNVVGSATLSGAYQIGGVNVLSSSALGTGVTTSSLTSVGTLTTLTAGNTNITGNLTVASGGVTQLDKLVVRSFDVSLGISLNNATELCKIEGSNLAYVADLSVMQAQSSVYNVGKQYTFSVSDSTLTGTNVWHRLVPLASSEQNNVIVEIQHNNGITNLRLVRPAAGGDTVFACVLKLHLPPSGSVTVTPLSGTSTVAGGASTTMFENTLVTQVNGRVGINTDAPASGYQLDVRGNAKVNGTMNVVGSATLSGAYQIGGVNVLSSSALGTGVTTSSLTSVGTLGSLAVTNGITAATVSATSLIGALTTVTQPSITSVGTLGNLSVSGNVTAGNLSTNAISATAITGTLATASQPNITSIGTLDSLAVTNGIAAANLTLGGDINLDTGIADVRNFRVSNECILNATVSGTAVSSSVTSGSSSLITSGGVYSAINLVSGGALGKLDAFDTLSVGTPTKPGTFTTVGDAEFNTRTYDFRSVVSASDQSWASLCYGNGLFVAVSDGTTNPGVMTSTDGRVWFSETAAPSTGNAWRGVAYGNGLYVAIASNGSIMRRSTGSTTWTAVRTDTVVRWTSIAYGNNLFVAVSSDNAVLVGDNTATTWTTNTGIANQTWNSVAFSGTTFVAVASSGAGIRVATSTNGSTWTSRRTPADLAWKTIGYGNGTFVALADAGAYRIMTSDDDGVTWSLRTNPVSLSWKSVAYGDSLWIAVASDGVGNGIMTSTDNGRTWTVRKPPVDLAWDAIAFGDSTFVAVAASGTGNRAMILSTDPRTNLMTIDGSSPRMDIVSPNLSIAATTTTIQGNLAVTKVTGTTNCFYLDAIERSLGQ